MKKRKILPLVAVALLLVSVLSCTTVFANWVYHDEATDEWQLVGDEYGTSMNRTMTKEQWEAYNASGILPDETTPAAGNSTEITEPETGNSTEITEPETGNSTEVTEPAASAPSVSETPSAAAPAKTPAAESGKKSPATADSSRSPLLPLTFSAILAAAAVFLLLAWRRREQ